MNASVAGSPATALPTSAHEPSSKRTRALITPEGIAVPIVVASRGSRFGALMLDFMLIFAAQIAFFLFALWIAGDIFSEAIANQTGPERAVLEFLVISLFLFLFVSRYGYFLAMELGPRGATFGKRALGIRVAARNGARLTPEAVLARNLVRDIELFIPLSLITSGASSGEMGAFGFAAFIWVVAIASLPFFNKDALRAGDIIAGTWVVEAPKTKLEGTISTQGAAGHESASTVTGARYEFGDAELSVYGERELQTLERLLREGKDEALYAVHETICRKIGWDPGAGDERAFLEAFYSQLRARLENDMRFGKRKADKYS
jgi:uncharacterized RDD family membrane protein YckC